MVATHNTHKNLAEAKAGIKSWISHFSNKLVAGKLLSMGVLPGSEIKLIRRSTFGNTYYVKTENQLLALRKREAACIVLR